MKKLIRVFAVAIAILAGISAISAPTSVHAEGGAPVPMCPDGSRICK